MTPEIGQFTWHGILANQPIAVFSYPLEVLQSDPLHVHQHHQIVYCEKTAVQLQLGSASVEMPEDTAFLLPKGVHHALAACSRSVIHCVYFKAAVPSASPAPVFLNRLSKELILEIPHSSVSDPSRNLMSSCLYDQIGLRLWAQLRSIAHLDRRLRAVCALIIDDPASDIALADLARRFCVSERTLRRMAQQQLGCSILEWRTKCRVFEATRLLQAGTPITHVGEQVGYRSESAFFVAFKRVVGSTPARFQRSVAPGADNCV